MFFFLRIFEAEKFQNMNLQLKDLIEQQAKKIRELESKEMVFDPVFDLLVFKSKNSGCQYMGCDGSGNKDKKSNTHRT
jgi:hypothetical protein